LALAVSVASFAPEAAFVCSAGAVLVLLDGGGDHVCVPARMARRTCLISSCFAALSVDASWSLFLFFSPI
jgi:hypothetical protein